ncbi:MAG: leucine-rich repeat domain-containing protein [Ruminococcaceae bacterium]|nr:leucine-rich repeat domain-containing protein [Oscillospiraceae bacterium]
MAKRSFFTVLSALLLTLTCFFSPLILISCDSEQTDKLVFQLNEDQITYSVVKYKGYGGTVTIPEYYNDMRVTEIGIGAFEGSTVRKVILPESITKIDLGAFNNCVSLKTIVIPESVTEIEHEAFRNCRNLKSITLPQGLVSIYESTFANCSDAKIQYTGTRSELSGIMLNPGYFCGTGALSYDYEIECSDGKLYISTLYYV